METKAHKDLTDTELLDKYRQSGDKVFVGVLYKRYSHLVFGLCMKYFKDQDQAYDTSVNIFTKLFDDLKKHKVEYFKSWLYTFSKNHCLMVIRTRQSKLKKEIELQIHADYFMETGDGLHLNKAEEKEQQYIALEKAIDDLNDDQKKCVTLFYLKEKSYTEIDEMTGYTMNEVKSFIQNGKRNLKIKLEKTSESE